LSPYCESGPSGELIEIILVFIHFYNLVETAVEQMSTQI
jgi:hypothetical protein